MPVCSNVVRGRCHTSSEAIDLPEAEFKRPGYKKLCKTCSKCREANLYYKNKGNRRGQTGGIKPKESELVKGEKPKLRKVDEYRYRQWLELMRLESRRDVRAKVRYVYAKSRNSFKSLVHCGYPNESFTLCGSKMILLLNEERKYLERLLPGFKLCEGCRVVRDREA